MDFPLIVGYQLIVAKLKTTYVPFAPPQARAVVSEHAAPISLTELKSILENELKLGSSVQVQEAVPSDPCLIVSADKLIDVMKFLRDQSSLEFNFLQVVSAVDYIALPATDERAEVKPRVEVIYVLYSFARKMYLNVKVVLPRDAAKVHTVSHLFRAANWYERECFDMFGIEFVNHPHLERILLPEDWVGYPLQKDYKFPEEYNGMKVPL